MAVTIVLLAGGYATRLYPLTKDRPKALLPLGRGVILDEVLKALEMVADVRKRILVTNHRFADQFLAWQRACAAPVQVIDDGTDTAENRLGAIRDLELSHRQTDAADDLLVLGTDNLFGWPLADFVAQAQRRRPHPSVALWQAPSKEAVTQFGVVIRDDQSRIRTFVEKSAQPPSTEVALCVYYFPSAMCGKIREFLDSGGNADAPGYFIEWLVRQGTVYGVPMAGAWYDIGSLETYHAAVEEWQAKTDRPS